MDRQLLIRGYVIDPDDYSKLEVPIEFLEPTDDPKARLAFWRGEGDPENFYSNVHLALRKVTYERLDDPE